MPKQRAGQSIIEYILLVVIAITALLASNLFKRDAPLRKALDNHFDIVRTRITGD